MSDTRSSPTADDPRRRWLADTLQFHLPAMPSPPGSPVAPVPNLQLTPPTMTVPRRQAAPNLGVPPLTMPASPGPVRAAPQVPSLTPQAPMPIAAQAEGPDIALTGEGVEVSAEAERPNAGHGPVQLFPSVRGSVTTPWNGGPIGPQVRGPVTSASVGATVLQVGNEDLNAQLRASIQAGAEGLSGNAALHVQARIGGGVNAEAEVDQTGAATIGVSGRF